MEKDEIIVGIDLGTTNCSVTAIDSKGTTTLVKNSLGEYITPSAVYFGKTKGDILIGKKAKAMSLTDPNNLVLFVKREMGNDKAHVRYSNIDMTYSPYRFFHKVYSPEEISGFILNQLRMDAENYLHTTISKAVITCPSYFGESQRAATKQAGKLARLDVMEIFPEPTAAALSYCTTCGASSKYNNRTETVLVFDLGGGTFDVTILNIKNTREGKDANVITTTGDHRLGGMDWDAAIVSYMVDEFDNQYRTTIDYDEDAQKVKLIGELTIEVEKAKVALFSKDKDSVSIHMSYKGGSLDKEISRELYNNITSELTNKCKESCDMALSQANMDWSDINTVLMIGSMSNCLPIQAALQEWSNKKIHIDLVNPKTCVSEGAAIRGYMLEGGHIVKSLISKPRYDDFEQTKAIMEEAEEAERTGDRTDTTIHSATNVISQSLGLQGLRRNGDVTVKQILLKDTTYPCEVTRSFPVARDGDQELSLVILEGESDIPDECTPLGSVKLDLGGKLNRGDRIEITFAKDNSGLLEVRAKNDDIGLDIVANIERKGCLSEEEMKAAQENMDDFFLG